MSAQTDSVVTDAPVVVPTQERPLVVSGTTLAPPSMPAAPPPARRRNGRVAAAVIGAGLTGIALGLVTGVAVTTWPDGSATGSVPQAVSRTSDLSEVAHGTRGGLADGTGAPIGRPVPPAGAAAPLRVDDLDEVVHGTRGNLYTGAHRNVGPATPTSPPSQGSGSAAAAPAWHVALATKLAAIGS